MKKIYIAHPFLIATFHILFLFSHNPGQAALTEIFLPIIIVFIFTLLFMLVLKVTLKDPHKAGIVMSLFLVLFFSYGHIYTLGLNWDTGHLFIGRHRYLILFWISLFSVTCFFITKTRRNLSTLTRILNAAAFSLVIISLVTIGMYQFNKSEMKQEKHISPQKKVPATAHQENDRERPDIYYVILDGYASSTILKEIYDYDNGEFIDYLANKGFYVASDSKSNYVDTSTSLASSLNMEYVNYLSDALGENSNNKKILYEMIRNSKVMNFLRSRGYTFIHFSSTSGALERNSYADVDIRCSGGISEFQMVLLETTMLKPFHANFIAKLLRKKILFAFSKLVKIHQTKSPKFIFAHMLLPHPPFIFDAEGKPIPASLLKLSGRGWTNKEKYLDHLIFVNNKVKVFLDELLLKSQTPPIIILQADHGPAALISSPAIDGWHNPNDNMLKERVGILNAYYLPRNGRDLLYKSISPVNTFRLIFNFYFNTDYELLRERNYFSNSDQPYKFIDVTDRVTNR